MDNFHISEGDKFLYKNQEYKIIYIDCKFKYLIGKSVNIKYNKQILFNIEDSDDNGIMLSLDKDAIFYLNYSEFYNVFTK